MIILTLEEYGDGTKDVLCSGCLNIIGRLGGDEIAALSHEGMDGIYCFDCDNVGADIVHPSLLSELRVTDFVVVADVDGALHLDVRVIFWGGHVRTRGGVSGPLLSSYTISERVKNKITKEKGNVSK